MRKTNCELRLDKARLTWVKRGAELCAVAALMLPAAGCGPVAEKTESAQQTFEGKGVVVQIQPGGTTVVIKHEAISNYMGAMTMPFDVADTNELRGLQSGDLVRFELVVTPKAGWIDHLTKLNKTPREAPAAEMLHFSNAAAALDEGDTLPNFRFTNELGQAVELDQFRGEPIAFTFFFTSCPFPNYCPRMTENFGEVAAKLAGDPAHCPRWHLFSVSFDTSKDTPAKLLDYARAHRYDPAHWSFLSADARTIQRFADLFDQRFWSEGESIGHNLRTVVIDPAGRVQKIFEGNQWTPDEMVAEMFRASSKTESGPG